MTDKLKTLWQGDIPEFFKELLGDSVVFSEEGLNPNDFTFKFGTENPNVWTSSVDLNIIKESPLGFIPNEMIEDELIKILVKRFFSHDGTLNIDDYKDAHVDKSFTVKVLNDYSIGHISDIVLNFAATKDVDLFGLRSYIFHLLSYMSMLEKANLISFPVELDCGITANSFFIQMSCLNNGFMLDNIEDYLNKKDSHQGMLINRLVESTQFLDIMGLKSSNKLVFTSCWFEGEDFNECRGLLIHGIDKFKKGFSLSGQSVGSLIDHSLENIAKVKNITDVLPVNYSKLEKEQGKLKEIINPLKVKKVLNFLINEKNIVQGRNYLEEDIKDILVDYPDQSFIHKLRKEELEAVIQSLRDEETMSVLEADTNIIRSKVSNQELMEKVIQSIHGMSEDEAEDFFEGSGAIPDFQRVRGQGRENLGETTTRVKGEREGDFEESHVVKGHKNTENKSLEDKVTDIRETAELKHKSLRPKNTDSEDNNSFALEEPVANDEILERVKEQAVLSEKNKGIAEDIEDEEVFASLIQNDGPSLVRGGDAEDDVAQKIQGLKEELGEETQRVRGLESEEEGNQVIKGDDQVEDDDIQHIAGIDEETDDIMKVKGGQESDQTALTKIKGANPQLKKDNSVWEVKKLNVISEIQKKVKALADQDVSQEKINEEIQSIITQQLGVDNKKSVELIEAISDSVAEEVVEEGISPLNDQIKQRMALEKAENQLQKRNQQVEKMNQLISRLKDTNGELIQKNKNLDSEVRELRFKDKQNGEVIENLEGMIDQDESSEEVKEDIMQVKEGTGEVNSSQLKHENEKLEAQVEQLKKKITFMYENNKTNSTSMDASDVQNIVDKSEELKGQITSYRAEIEKMKNEARDQETTIKNMTKELREKEALVKDKLKTVGGSETKVMEAENKKLKDDIKGLEAEKKELYLKTKSFEQKFKFMNAQIDRFKKNEQKLKMSGKGGISDAQVKNKVKQLETLNGRMKQAYSKVEKELGDKKTELHKVGLENKTLSVKIRELEKKLEILGRKAS